MATEPKITLNDSAEEAAETPEYEATEDETTEETPESTAKVSEEYQKQVEELVFGSTAEELDYLCSQADSRRKEISKSKTSAEKAGVFDSEGMPE